MYPKSLETNMTLVLALGKESWKRQKVKPSDILALCQKSVEESKIEILTFLLRKEFWGAKVDFGFIPGRIIKFVIVNR